MKQVFGIVAVLVCIGLVWNSVSDGDSEAASDKAARPVKLIAARSSCLADPFNAKLHFFITVRNPATVEQDVDARPWRRYSDNGTNDSIMDTLTMTVPARTTKKFKAEFGYNAEAHSVLECGLYFDGSGTITKINVVG